MRDQPMQVTRPAASRLPQKRYPASTTPPYASPRAREKALRIALFTTAVAGVLVALAALERYRFATEGLRLGAVTSDRFDALGHRRGIAEVFLVLTGAAAGVTWLLWFGRIYGNLQALGAHWTRLSIRTALICCALPGINLVVAPWLTAEAWRGSDPAGPDRHPPGTRRLPPLAVTVWTVVLLLTLLIGVVAEKVAHRTLEQLGPVRSGAPFEAFAAVLVAGSALLTIWLASSLTARQEARAAHLAGPPEAKS